MINEDLNKPSASYANTNGFEKMNGNMNGSRSLNGSSQFNVTDNGKMSLNFSLTINPTNCIYLASLLDTNLVGGLELFFNQTIAMFMKKFYYTIRNYVMLIIMFFIPLLFLFITMAFEGKI